MLHLKKLWLKCAILFTVCFLKWWAIEAFNHIQYEKMAKLSADFCPSKVSLIHEK